MHYDLEAFAAASGELFFKTKCHTQSKLLHNDNNPRTPRVVLKTRAVLKTCLKCSHRIWGIRVFKKNKNDYSGLGHI